MFIGQNQNPNLLALLLFSFDGVSAQSRIFASTTSKTNFSVQNRFLSVTQWIHTSWRFHSCSSENSNSGSLECDATSLGVCLPTFQRNALASSSWVEIHHGPHDSRNCIPSKRRKPFKQWCTVSFYSKQLVTWNSYFSGSCNQQQLYTYTSPTFALKSTRFAEWVRMFQLTQNKDRLIFVHQIRCYRWGRNYVFLHYLNSVLQRVFISAQDIFPHTVQVGFWGHPVSSSVSIGVSSPRDKVCGTSI